MKHYDVIIIGAGPAGLKCAEQFKGSNLSVLLIEKNKIIGQKVCAGGLTNLRTSLDLPESRMRSFDKQILYLEDKRYEIKLIHPLRTVDRYDLGQCLLKKIKGVKNITISRETIAKQIKKDRIITNKGEFYYKYLVGADGSNSIVRKFLGLKSEISIGLCYKIPKISRQIKIYFYPKLLGTGYIWIFPHKKYTNIGVGIHTNSNCASVKKAKEILEKFLKKNGFDYASKKLEAAPINSLYKGCVFNNNFLVGDAAGVLIKTTGEGIAQAMVNGEEIGKKILDPNYKMVGLDEILKIKAKQERAGKLADKLPFLRKYIIKIFIKLMKIEQFQSYLGM
ncbi:MAG: NAD(P)/FAD-dependent oxidoreductase [Patescibacteria group bacterium]